MLFIPTIVFDEGVCHNKWGCEIIKNYNNLLI